jgi:hypothetical protein
MVEGAFDCEDMLSADAVAMQHSSAMCQHLLMRVERLKDQVSIVVPPCGYPLADLLGSVRISPFLKLKSPHASLLLYFAHAHTAPKTPMIHAPMPYDP